MYTVISAVIGAAIGLLLLAVVAIFAFRYKPKSMRVQRTENHDVFNKDPSYYSSYDDHQVAPHAGLSIF